MSLFSQIRLFTLLTGAGLAASLPMACGDEALPSGATNPDGGYACVDEDGDGFGVNCPAGPDCDDTDPSVGPCVQDRCATPKEGCPCDDPGARIPCGETVSQVNGQEVCGEGERSCNPNGSWGECVINHSVTLLGAPEGGQRVLALGDPVPCADPCDPYCQTFPDDPGGLGNEDAGIAITDGGITLIGADGAIVTPGAVCTGGSLGACAHHACEVGGPLGGGCDEVGLPPACIPRDSACGGSTPCCYGLSCVSGVCREGAGPMYTFYSEDFSSGAAWTRNGNWQINAASSNSAGDPSTDTSPSTDNRLAGTIVNGSYGNNRDDSLVSPIIDTTVGTGPVTLIYRSWVHIEAVYDHAYVEVSTNGGTTWTNIHENFTTTQTWTTVNLDISAYRSTQFRVRFRLRTDGSVVGGGWSVDDIALRTQGFTTNCSAEGGSCASGGSCCNSPSCDSGVCTTPDRGCVQQVCDARPSCCTTAWDPMCVSMVETVCGNECATNAAGTCELCWQDNIDHDGDGFSWAQGDCRDCDPQVNPGAFDIPGNGIDEDCSGVADDEPVSCDNGLPFASTNPADYARAIDLCRTTNAASSNWGVISSRLIRANGSDCTNTLQRAITNRFGSVGSPNTPRHGANLAAFSSGTARDTDDPGYYNPNSGYAANGYVPPPPGFPVNGPGCPAGTAAYDSCGLEVVIRAPTNAQSLAYDFRFFSSEYPEWVCTQYNDTYIALYDSAAPGIPANRNISFDSAGNPVSVNIGFFDVPGAPNIYTHPALAGTGLDGNDGANRVRGGATSFLTTTAPVIPGETITLRFLIWDTGDQIYDSTVLLDNFRWSTQPASVETQPVPVPVDPVILFDPGDFIRTYDTTNVCPHGSKVRWGHWSWSTTTPDDSQVEFYIRTATTAAGLDSATEIPLRFTNPPGPSALNGQHAIARANYSGLNTQGGSLVVDSVLASAGVPRQLPFVRVRSRLTPTTDRLNAPTLAAWNLAISCQPEE